MPYQYTMLSFQDPARSAAAQETMDQMEADGWDMHTVIPNYSELYVMWHRPRPGGEPVRSARRKRQEAAPVPEPEAPGPPE